MVEAVAVPPVEVALVEDPGPVAPQGMVRPSQVLVPSTTTPRELVEEEETVAAAGLRAGSVLVPGPATAPVAVRVARRQPLAAVGMPMVPVPVQAVAAAVVPTGPAGLVPEAALVKALARVA